MENKQTKREKLLAVPIRECPFCGGEGEYNNSDHGPYEWIECKECGAKGPSKNYNEYCLGAGRVFWNARFHKHEENDDKDETA